MQLGKGLTLHHKMQKMGYSSPSNLITNRSTEVCEATWRSRYKLDISKSTWNLAPNLYFEGNTVVKDGHLSEVIRIHIQKCFLSRDCKVLHKQFRFAMHHYLLSRELEAEGWKG